MTDEGGLFDGAGFGICVIDLHGGEVFRNQRCADFCHHAVAGCAHAAACPFAALPRNNLESDFQFLHAFEVDGKFVDLAIFRANGREFRFAFPLDGKIAGVTSEIKPHGLTQRELEVAAMMVTGLNNAAISDKLGISRNTLKSHLKNIYRKISPSGHRLFGTRETQGA